MEMRINKVIAVGRMVGNPVQTESGAVHFKLQASYEGLPFHCFCVGRTAENLMQYRQAGDEMSVEGSLEVVVFTGDPTPRQLIKAQFISYGRKQESLRAGDVRGGIAI